MRKMQLAIIEKAKKNNYQENVIEMLSDETYTINTLEKIYAFYSYHHEEVDDPKVYFDIRDFNCDIVSEIGSRFYFLIFTNTAIKNIIWIKKQYEKGIFTADDVYKLDIIQSIYKKDNFDDVLEFYNTRKEYFKDFPMYNHYKVLDLSMDCLYGKYPNLTLPEKLKIEYDVLSNKIQPNDDFLKESTFSNASKYGYYYSNAVILYTVNKIKPIFDLMKKHFKNSYTSQVEGKTLDNNYQYDYAFRHFPDIKTMENFVGITEQYPELFVDGRSAKFTAASPLPYKVSLKASSSGVCITFETFTTYKLCFKKIQLEDLDSHVEILFTYDKKCFIKNTYLKRWTPISLQQMSQLYAYSFFKSIFNTYIDLFSEDYTVWKDIKSLLNKGSGMPPLNANDVLFKSKKEMMLSLYKKADVINWNKKDLYTGYLTMKALPHIRESDKNILIDYVNRHDMMFTQGKLNNKVNELISKVIKSRICKNHNLDDEFDIKITDYINMSIKFHRKVSLSFNSPNSLKEAHDELVIISRDKHVPKVTIPKNTKFNHLRKMLPDDFEWIKSKRRLITEGVKMNHCVATYADEINRDHCAIYSIVYGEHRYTIEFCNIGQNKYNIVQIQGKNDSGCPQEVRDYVKSFIEEK